MGVELDHILIEQYSVIVWNYVALTSGLDSAILLDSDSSWRKSAMSRSYYRLHSCVV